MTYTIYQVKKDNPDGRKFMCVEWHRTHNLRIHSGAYDNVYSDGIYGYSDAEVVLEKLFERFNVLRPAGFKGHSLSVSDVVVLTEAGLSKAYFCDISGWTEVPGFLGPEIHHYGVVKLRVCPNRCNSLFATSAHVVQTWKVDAFGNFVDEISTDSTTHGPDDGNTWECLECGAEAELVECLRVGVRTGDAQGSVYLPVTPRGYAYWIHEGMTASEYIPITPDDRGTPTVKLDGQVFYLSDLQKGE